MNEIKSERMSATRGLIALNIAMVGLLGVVTLVPAADAQRSRRARGEYTMVAGKVTGLEAAGVYIIDANNEELVAVRWNQSQNKLEPLGYRNLAEDAAAARSGR